MAFSNSSQNADQKSTTPEFNQQTQNFRLDHIQAPTIFSDWYLDGQPDSRTQEQKAACENFAFGVDSLGGNPGIQRINNRYDNTSISDAFPDAKQSFEAFNAAAKDGYAAAINNLGISYELGLGVATNLKTAAYHYNILALEVPRLYVGHYNIGVCYLYGLGVPKDLTVATAYFNEAIKADVSRSEPWHALGIVYAYKGNIEDSFTAFKRAADKGFPKAQYEIAMLITSGTIKKDVYFDPEAQAITFFQLAAISGYPPAEFKYGEILLELNPSIVKAKDYLLSAASKNFLPAVERFSRLYPSTSSISMTMFPAVRKLSKVTRNITTMTDVKSAGIHSSHLTMDTVDSKTQTLSPPEGGKSYSYETDKLTVTVDVWNKKTLPLKLPPPIPFPPDLKHVMSPFECKLEHNPEVDRDNKQIGFITEQRDITTFRRNPLRFHPKTGIKYQLTKGDLHANGLNLISDLVEFGFVNLTPEDEKTLVSLYKKEDADKLSFYDTSFSVEASYSTLTNEDIEILNNIVGYFHPSTKQWIPGRMKVIAKPFLRLIGDNLADRGANDLFVIQLITFLSVNENPFEILFSNHDWDFIALLYDETTNYMKAVHENYQHNSLIKLLALTIGQPPRLKREAVHQFLEEHYFPHLKLVSYCLSEDHKALTIFSHAPRGLRTIAQLANDLEVFDKKIGKDYLLKSKAALIDVINKINQRFQELIKTIPGRMKLLSLDSIFKIAWGRGGFADMHDTSSPDAGFDNEFSSIVFELEDGTKTNFVCGHDETNLDLSHHVTLDNKLGKVNLDPNEYRGYVSIGHVAPQPKPIARMVDETPPPTPEVRQSLGPTR